MKHENVGFPRERVGLDLRGLQPDSPADNRCHPRLFFKDDGTVRATEEDCRGCCECAPQGGGYISRHEVMQQLYSDRGLDGDSQLCLELSKVYKRYKTYTTAYAPGSNRMVERSDKTYKAILRALNVHGKR